ncbi:cell division regulator GpsB [Vagococcus coleopterorum]|uniref:Cell division regulator GpsB n=1 Tax=Vagococcus coleopterorum TaxID=2714946 RepID=A0A6G8ANB5_9ENTE|nr:cell division regulator GpsB [Vagococcus coleopterorum]QIL46487.1 cell division regulator GpsB [Vagococcus coleopterorum]
MAINYDAREILQKEFTSKMRGYNPVEVDEFLDGVIKDYETFTRELLSLREENQRLKAKVEQMTKSQETLSRIKQEPVTPTASATNFDILKRLSSLEKEVFGKKLTAEEVVEEVTEIPVFEEATEEVVEATQAEDKFSDTMTVKAIHEDLEQTRTF